MTALLSPPEAPAPAAGPRRARRRLGRRLTAVAVGVVLGGLAWSALLWAPSTVDVSTSSTTFDGGADVVTLPGYGPQGTHVVDYRDGAVLDVTVSLRNDGPLPVEVTSAAAESGHLPLFDVQSVDGLPLALPPGESGEVVLNVRLSNCAYYHEREVQNVRDLRLETRVGLGPLRRTTEASLPLDRPLLVHSPMIVGCPERKIDRQAANRRDVL